MAGIVCFHSANNSNSGAPVRRTVANSVLAEYVYTSYVFESGRLRPYGVSHCDEGEPGGLWSWLKAEVRTDAKENNHGQETPLSLSSTSSGFETKSANPTRRGLRNNYWAIFDKRLTMHSVI